MGEIVGQELLNAHQLVVDGVGHRGDAFFLGGVAAKGVKLKAQSGQRVANFVSENGGGQAALGELALLFQLSALSFAFGRAPEAISENAHAADDQEGDERLPADFLDQRPFDAPEIFAQLGNGKVEVDDAARFAILFPHE